MPHTTFDGMVFAIQNQTWDDEFEIVEAETADDDGYEELTAAVKRLGF